MERSTQAFPTRQSLRHYHMSMIIMSILSILFTLGLILYKNPVSPSSPAFMPIVLRRGVAIIAMLLAAFANTTATLTFQSLTNNRIITPSLLGFDALYGLIQTLMVMILGVDTFSSSHNLVTFVLEIILMMALSLSIYGTLLKDSQKDMQYVLLIGIILGTGLRAISSFFNKLLSPSEFDVLQAKMFGSVNNSKSEYFLIAIPIIFLSVIILLRLSKKLNIITLGKDISSVLGINHRFYSLLLLSIISLLMAVSTAMLGLLTFYGFLVVTFTYEIVGTSDHQYTYPFAILFAYLVITASYFFMYHIFNAQGVVSIIIELVSGIVFIIMMLRKHQGE